MLLSRSTDTVLLWLQLSKLVDKKRIMKKEKVINLLSPFLYFMPLQSINAEKT